MSTPPNRAPLPIADLLAATRSDLDLSLQAFAALLSRVGGAVISRQRLRAWEHGRAITGSIAEVCASLDNLTSDLRDGWRELLRDPDALHPLPDLTPARRRSDLLTIAQHVNRNRRWADYRRLAANAGMDLDANLDEARRRLALTAVADRSWTLDPADAVTIVATTSTLTMVVGHGELFLLTVTLANTGPVLWRDRLLVRLGPPVASSLTFTPPVLSIPDTAPGGSCSLAIPGRSSYFPNLSMATYAMTFPDCTPAISGGLHLSIDAKEQPGRTNHPLPETVEAEVRGDGSVPTSGRHPR